MSLILIRGKKWNYFRKQGQKKKSRVVVVIMGCHFPMSQGSENGKYLITLI